MPSTNTMPVNKPAPPLYGGTTTSTANMYDNNYSAPNIPKPVAQESIANSLTSPVPPPSTINKQPSTSGGFHDPPKVEYKRSPYVPYSTLNQPRTGTYSSYNSSYNAPASVTSPLQPASSIPNNNATGYTSTTSATTTATRNDFTPPPLPNIYGLTSSSGFNSLPTISNSLNGNPLPESKPAIPQNAPPMMGQTQPSMYGTMNPPMNPVAPPKPVEEPPAKPRYPEGDRSHIPDEFKSIEPSLTKVLQYATQCGGNQRILDDAQKKFNSFYDQLNNDEISDKAALNRLVELCKALDINDLMTAQTINMELMTTKFEAFGHVLQCIKRLLDILSRAYMQQQQQQQQGY